MVAQMRSDITENNPKAFGKLTQKRAWALMIVAGIVAVVIGRGFGVIKGGCSGIVVFLVALWLSANVGGVMRFTHFRRNFEGAMLVALANPRSHSQLTVRLAKMLQYKPWQAWLSVEDNASKSAEDDELFIEADVNRFQEMSSTQTTLMTGIDMSQELTGD